jgi:tyrosinase
MAGSLSRRIFLKASAAGAVAAPFVLRGAGGEAQTTPYIRRDIFTLDPNGPEIASLRLGIATMMARPATDPTSWIYQANIHGTFDSVTSGQIWNQCKHGSYFFFSWHRMYLFYFEKILRAASGDPNLTLPYWNWTNPACRALPTACLTPADPVANPLYVTQRAAAINAGAELPPEDVDMTQSFGLTNFFTTSWSGVSFGGLKVSSTTQMGPHGTFESEPHDTIHVDIGGYMQKPQTAARDPIFYLHHCNIDRLWKRWLDQGGGRANPTGDSFWMWSNFPFYNDQGKKVQTSAYYILNTKTQLHYVYDDDPGVTTTTTTTTTTSG